MELKYVSGTNQGDEKSRLVPAEASFLCHLAAKYGIKV
jgi:hypothetical protein